MAFPEQINPADPADSDSPAFGAQEFRTLKQVLLDFFGIPANTAITGPIMGLGTNLDGKVDTAPVVKTASPFLRLIGTEAGHADIRLAESGGIFLLQYNTNTEAAPIWSTVLSIDVVTGHFTANRLPNGWINVFGYGAVGDGVTDDTTAIQNAVTAGGGTLPVFFPPGNYKVSSSIVLPSGSRLVGSGTAATRIFASVGTFSVLVMTATATFFGAAVESMWIDGAGQSSVQGVVINGVDATKRVIEVRLTDLKVTSCSRGVYLIFCANSFLTNLFLSACVVGVRLQNCADSNLVDCEAQNGSGAGFEVVGNAAPVSEGYRFTGCSTNGQGKGLTVASGAHWGIVTGCSFTTCPALNCVEVSASVHWRFEACEFASTTGGAGIVTDASCSQIQVVGCFFSLNAISLAVFADRSTIVGNSFEVGTNADIVIDGAFHCTVANNVCDSNGIATSITELFAADYNSFQGNVCRGAITVLGAHSIKPAGTNIESYP